jgi:uncharacterized protein YbjT (DUF2867 family)
MAPTILIVGATGNTGRPVVETLSKLLSTSNDNPLSGHRILALTRSAKSPVAQGLAALPGVEVLEQNWVEITADWLRAHQVVRAFIASHNEPTHFSEESSFQLAALQAGVKYVVRISTTAANVRPDCPAAYSRAHWAIEALLSTPEFEALQWTSLQPNVFPSIYLTPAAALIKQYRETGKQDKLRLMAAADAPVGTIHPDDVGAFAARLLFLEDGALQKHNRAKYNLNGPEDITGEQIVKMVEQYIGTPVESVSYKDTLFLEGMPEHAVSGIRRAAEESWWAGKCAASLTSREVLELAPPTRTPAAVLKALLEE